MALVSLQYQAGQSSTCICTSIDIDAIGQHFRLLGRRMTVHDDLAKIHRAGEKLIADPQQVCRAPAFERDARTDSSMTEENKARALLMRYWT